MKQKEQIYIAIDLKSFFASVECAQREYDPLNTNLVVADASRTAKTICLAVSPSLKQYGIPGRARLFEVIQKVKQVNARRLSQIPEKKFEGKSIFDSELKENQNLEVAFEIAPPQMAEYIKKSTEIYNIYLKYVSPEDMHVYSIDEVFIDVTHYLGIYQMTPEQLARKMIQDVFDQTQITATAGIGSNMYLCKIAMDIVAKHMPPDENGVRIASLDEKSYRKQLWNHQPLTDFWRVGKGYMKRLHEVGIYTMGDIARCSIGKETDFYNEDLLYKIFGVNAELLIDHAWGWEPCTIAQVKAYRPEVNSLGHGQVLQSPYTFAKARVVIREMADGLVLELVDKKLVTDQIVLTVGYDIDNLTRIDIKEIYRGPVTTDGYNRKVPKAAHGSKNLNAFTSSTVEIMDAVTQLFDEIVDEHLLIRRMNLTFNHVVDETEAKEKEQYTQMNLFSDFLVDTEGADKEKTITNKQKKENQQKEKQLQQAMIDIKKKYGKNAVLRGMNFEEGATARERNQQIGGHKA